jgi:hypothetical protein
VPSLAAVPVAVFAALAFSAPIAVASDLLFEDSFDAASLDATRWTGLVGDASFVGRTQFRRVDLEPPPVANGAVTLQLDTWNPYNGPVASLYGTDILTIASFARGIAFEVRVGPSALPRGAVVGLFLYRFHDGVRDEIDFELLGNDRGDASCATRVLTNVFDDDGFDQAGDVLHVCVPGLDLDAANTFRIEWGDAAIRWLVNGVQVREEVDTIPDASMQVHLNFWAPAPDFALAYDPSIGPAASAEENQSFEVPVELVRVESLPEADRDALGGAAVGGIAALGRYSRRRRQRDSASVQSRPSASRISPVTQTSRASARTKRARTSSGSPVGVGRRYFKASSMVATWASSRSSNAAWTAKPIASSRIAACTPPCTTPSMPHRSGAAT